MKEKLVSLITPCYNGEKFVHRLFNSVINQTYTNIEHIFVDDGSTDKTAQIVQEYITKYKEVGKELIYIYQENAKAAAALNNGLKIFKGDYLTWPDSDDFYSEKDSIKKMVKTFEGLSSEYGMVRCDAFKINEETLRPISKFSDNNPHCYNENLFEDCLLERNMWYAPGCYMTKKIVIDEVINGREIFANNDVQNWQMYLPILYKHRCFFINEPLFNYLVRSNSYCNQVLSFDLDINRTTKHEEIILESLKKIDMTNIEFAKYSTIIKKKYIIKRLNILFQYNKRSVYNENYSKIKNELILEIPPRIRLKHLIINIPVIYKFIKNISFFKRKY
jgi:glycosyltransferase involved in cell wall biosynthesis